MDVPFWIKDVFEAALPFAKDALKAAIRTRNEKALEEKKEKARKDHLALDEIQKIVLTRGESASADLTMSPGGSYDALKDHLERTEQLSTVIWFEDLSGNRLLDDVYVHLDTYLIPSRLHLSEREKYRTTPLEEAIFNSRRHCLILGQPGAGKSTSMQRLCSLLLKSRTENKGYTFPILIRFRDLKKDTSNNVIFNTLIRIFPLQFQFGGELDGPQVLPDLVSYKRSTFARFINEVRPVIILDGFDEYPDNMGKSDIAEEIQDLARLFTKAKLVVTCRTGEFNYAIDNTESFEIAPLDRARVEVFANRWLTEDDQAKRFLNEVYASPFADVAIKPLTLAHLCAIFQRNDTIPDRPLEVYKRVVNMMLTEWDRQRSVKRHSAYARFSTVRKFDFLAHVAYHLTVSLRRTVFSKRDFSDSYRTVYRTFGLPEAEADLVAAELESHTGIFVQSGYDKFEFVHKSIQEYLTADYISRLPNVPSDVALIEGLGAELAIVLAMSSEPSLYICKLVFNVLIGAELSAAFYDAFVGRLLLERPVFDPGEEVVIAFFSLLSLWMHRDRKSSIKDLVIPISDVDKGIYDQALSLMKSADVCKTVSRFYYAERAAAQVGCLVPIGRKQKMLNYPTLPYILASSDYTGGPFGLNHGSHAGKNKTLPWSR